MRKAKIITNEEPFQSVEVDPITLDVIESAAAQCPL
jgi:hypothetical protein